MRTPFQFLSRLFEAKSAAAPSLASPDAALLELFAGAAPTASGVAVSVATAMRHPAAACAIRIIAEAVATLPIITYRRDADVASASPAAGAAPARTSARRRPMRAGRRRAPAAMTASGTSRAPPI